MSGVLSNTLAVVIGLTAGTAAVVRSYRRYPELRDKPETVSRTLLIGCGGVALIIFLAWLLGAWNGVYLAFAVTFGSVLFAGYFIWPLLRSRRRERRTSG